MSESPGVTRRRLLQGAGAAGIGIGLGGTGYLVGQASAEDDGAAGTVPFYGAHQAGIATPAQDQLHFAAYDLTIDTAAELRDLLQEWTAAAIAMTQGELIGDTNNEPLAPADDTGEAVGLKPAQLTITFGLGPGVFERDGKDTLGLRAKKPAQLEPISPLPADELVPGLTGGDLCVQACSNDPQVAFHAVRNLTRIARGAVTMRWSQLGFGRTSSTTKAQATPRNLMGFKDGTRNLRADDGDDLDRFVWLGDTDQPEWMRGGTLMVTRRIRMLIEVWDRSSLKDQQDTIGRQKYSGAPLGGSREFDDPDLDAKGSGGPVIPADAHIRLAAPHVNNDEAILRLGYSFTDGVVEDQGQLDAGLFFIAFQRDPKRQFEAIQRRLGAGDALNEYISHVGSAIFAIPPGVSKGGFVGEGLFA